MFNMLVPITGSLDLTVEKDPVVTAVPGQAYYMSKGQTHSFTNKSAAAVQVIELFVMPPRGASADPLSGPRVCYGSRSLHGPAFIVE